MLVIGACSLPTPTSNDGGLGDNNDPDTASGSSDDAASDDPDSDDTAAPDDAADGQDSPDDTEEPTPAVELDAPVWADLDLELELIGEFIEPITLTARSGTNDLFVGERAGIVRRIERTFNQRGAERITIQTSPILDISESVSTDGERGLLGVAFSTDGRLLYVSYTDLGGNSVVEQYEIGRSNRVDLDSRRELLRVDQPFNNHNGGHLALGDDGFLYVGFGDGGSANDPDGNGQDPSTLLGTVVRLDPFSDGDSAYSIPAGNPFLDGGDGAPEVWLWGVRNPWRFSFDRLTGDLWLADVGQDRFEEINFLPVDGADGGRGANLGWAAVEGDELFEGSDGVPDDHTGPIHVISQETGACSITGGFVYRGEVMPLLDGVYVFGDYCTGEISGLRTVDGQVQVVPLSISSPRNQLVSFGEGPEGELYVVQSGGQVLRIEPAEIVEEEAEG